MLTARTIENRHSDVFRYLHGSLELTANHCHVPEAASPGSLVYASDAEQLVEARLRKPAIKEAMKTIANIGHLNEIRRNLHRVMKHLQLIDKANADSPDA